MDNIERRAKQGFKEAQERLELLSGPPPDEVFHMLWGLAQGGRQAGFAMNPLLTMDVLALMDELMVPRQRRLTYLQLIRECDAFFLKAHNKSKG